MVVELLPPSIENCGIHFAAGTMTCGTDIEDQAAFGHNFCHVSRPENISRQFIYYIYGLL